MSTKPIIFISYAHKDEPEKPAEGEVQWLTFVRDFVQPAVKHGVVDLWVDRHMTGGVALDPEIKAKLRACDIFILLVSRYSLASTYIVETEIAITRERQKKGENVHFYPLLLTPTPKAALATVLDMNLRPRDAKPFSSFSHHDRMQHMSEAADEIAVIANEIAERKASTRTPAEAPVTHPASIHITGLPETAYEKLVGRDEELAKLDAAWAGSQTNILSLVAEGGAGKSALVNEWLTRLQADNYRGAETVLGWSFYSQGTKERATSADGFLTWALEKLEITVKGTGAPAKGEAIAEALMQRRVLLVLDGVEPLQHGFDAQPGQLKDQGLRALLRRFASTPPAQAHGLVLLTSRLAITDIARWKTGVAPVEEIGHLSNAAGAALLRDNGVWGTDRQLAEASKNFGGHPLALGLLASFLTETQKGDVRRRDHIRAYLAAPDNPRHDHARRVMESYVTEWLAGHPVLLAILRMVGLFDRPASGVCLNALRAEPAIPGATDAIGGLSDDAWNRAVARLRAVRLLAPTDPTALGALDAHPLVREWFGESLKREDEPAWRAAHGRLYEHLRDTTQEGATPTLDDLVPLYQAVAHGCRARRYQEALDEIYVARICRKYADGTIEFYASKKLGAFGSNLATIYWFFDHPYSTPVGELNASDRAWIIAQASFVLRSQGRFAEALPAQRAEYRMSEDAASWRNAAIAASNLSQLESISGEIAAAVATAEHAVHLANQRSDDIRKMTCRISYADALHMAGRLDESVDVFSDAERRQKIFQPTIPFLYSAQGYFYRIVLLSKGEYTKVVTQANQALQISVRNNWLLDIALDTLTLGQAYLGSTLEIVASKRLKNTTVNRTYAAGEALNRAVDGFRAASAIEFTSHGLLARAAFRRSLGDWDGARRDLEEVFEIAEPGPMKLFICDRALEVARLALARVEGFAPLIGLVDGSPSRSVPSDAAEANRLGDEAQTALAEARTLITTCGYHRRDAELAELEAVLAGQRRFADLQPRV